MTLAAAAPLILPGLVRGYTPRAVDIGLALGGGGPPASARSGVQPGEAEEAALVAALARADARAIEIAYDRYSRSIYSLAFKLLGDASAAEEVVQETFLKLWRQPAAYQPNRGRLLSWLLGVAHHHAVDLLRRRQLEQRHRIDAAQTQSGDPLADMLDHLGLASNDDDPQSRLGTLEQRAAIRRALALLTPEQRLPLELAYYRGMTQLEIATRLGAPLGTIKTRMRLGLQQ